MYINKGYSLKFTSVLLRWSIKIVYLVLKTDATDILREILQLTLSNYINVLQNDYKTSIDRLRIYNKARDITK